MAGKAYDTKNDFEQCAALRDWRLSHAGALPRQRSDNAVEAALARWVSKALQRRQRALSDRPSQRQLTPDEAVHLNSIVDLAMGDASANAPASESIDTAAETRAAVGSRPHQRRPAELVPNPMTGKAYDTKNDFEQCAALREWRLTHAGALPRQKSDNAVEAALANWFSKALPRRQRALSDRPSQRQLTPDEAVHLNSILDLAMGQASANAPVSESSDTAAETPEAAGNRPHQRRPAEPVPNVASKRLRTKTTAAAPAVTPFEFGNYVLKRYYLSIKEGKKNAEGRSASKITTNMKKLKGGDLLKLREGQGGRKKEQLRCRILRVHCVHNLLEMFQLQSSGQLCLLPGVADYETFAEVYSAFGSHDSEWYVFHFKLEGIGELQASTPAEQEQEADQDLESQIRQLVAERNFAGAAALQEECNRTAKKRVRDRMLAIGQRKAAAGAQEPVEAVGGEPATAGPPRKRRRKAKPWFDEATVINKNVYRDPSAFTLELSAGHTIHLPHRRTGLPFTTLSSDMCQILSEPFSWALDIGEQCRRRQSDWHALKKVIA